MTYISNTYLGLKICFYNTFSYLISNLYYICGGGGGGGGCGGGGGGTVKTLHKFPSEGQATGKVEPEQWTHWLF
jgi:hypothetical protein